MKERKATTVARKNNQINRQGMIKMEAPRPSSRRFNHSWRCLQREGKEDKKQQQ